MRVLAINVEVPFPPVGGGLLRTYHLLRALAEKHEVTLVAFTFGDERAEAPFPIRIVAVPWQLPPLYQEMESRDDHAAKLACGRLCEIPEPWFVSYFASDAMLATLRRLVSQEEFDVVWIEDTDMAQFLPALPSGTPRVLDFHNVYSLMAKRATVESVEESASVSMEAGRTLRFEKEVSSQCTICVTCSDVEARAAKSLLGLHEVGVIPNGVDTKYFKPVQASQMNGNLLFTGTMSYPPNIDAVSFFAASILPLVLREDSSVKFHIVGAKPADEVKRLASNSIVVHGRVPDVRPYLSQAAVTVVPIRNGGGTRLKVLEAAASAKAIVSTTLGVEGLDFSNNSNVLIADAAEDFAAAILRLLNNTKLRCELGQRARRVSRKYDWGRVGRKFRELLEEVAS